MAQQIKGKGKGKEAVDMEAMGVEIHPAVTSAIEEALSTPLSSSIDSNYTSSPIHRPEPVHYPISMINPRPPRLLSQLSRNRIPTAGLSFMMPGISKGKARSEGIPNAGESSTAWRSSSPVEMDEPFPDLDPETGLPITRNGSNDTEVPSRHLQRTITDLLASDQSSASTQPSDPSSSTSLLPFQIPQFNLPSLPSMPNLPSMTNLPSISLPGRTSLDGNGQRRNMSSTPPKNDWGSWAPAWWSGNKSKVDSTLAKEDQADTVEEEVEKHRRKYRTPKNPVVFCHGLLGFDYLGPSSLPPLQISHWRGIREVLESNGVEVLVTRVAATASIADRAATLESLIAEKYPGRQVNLIGHSMGGLDCRYLISQIQPKAFTPISLTTISTPHRGSPFADYVIDNVIGRERLPSLLGVMEAMKLPQSGDGSAFNALGTRSMRTFNSEVLDREDVKYYSWGASFEPGLLDTFRWPHSVILAKEGPNDGLVSVNSARWGEYRGTLLGVNHLDLVGWVNHVRYVFSEWTGNPIAFKPATFYLEVADYLAEQGF